MADSTNRFSEILPEITDNQLTGNEWILVEDCKGYARKMKLSSMGGSAVDYNANIESVISVESLIEDGFLVEDGKINITMAELQDFIKNTMVSDKKTNPYAIVFFTESSSLTGVKLTIDEPTENLRYYISNKTLAGLALLDKDNNELASIAVSGHLSTIYNEKIGWLVNR